MLGEISLLKNIFMTNIIISKKIIIPVVFLIFLVLTILYGMSSEQNCSQENIFGETATVCDQSGSNIKFNPLLRPVSILAVNLIPIITGQNFSASGPIFVYKFYLVIIDFIYWVIIGYIIFRILKKIFLKSETQGGAALSSRPSDNNK